MYSDPLRQIGREALTLQLADFFLDGGLSRSQFEGYFSFLKKGVNLRLVSDGAQVYIITRPGLYHPEAAIASWIGSGSFNEADWGPAKNCQQARQQAEAIVDRLFPHDSEAPLMQAQAPLWAAKISEPIDDSVLALMHRAAEELRSLTDGLVLGKVVTRKHSTVKPYGIPDALRHTFFLAVPTIDDYHYELFSVIQRGKNLPLTIETKKPGLTSQDPEQILLPDWDSLRLSLLSLLASEETVSIVRNLLDIARRTAERTDEQ